MNYEETLQYLYSQMPEYQRVGQMAYKEGLDNSLALDDYFNHPHRQFNSIHVGGTNGKGSTSHLLAAILQESGNKVGLYTSPHLIDFRERIRVNGKMMDKQFVVDFVEKHRAAFEPIMPSFFELTMEMAFLYFAEQNIDIAVIEVGLGGRLDSTNIISPNLSVITNIGLEHTQYLGDTLVKIAGEKAGIIKPNTPVVIGETDDVEVAQVFYIKAQKEKAPIIFAEEAMSDLISQKTDKGWIFSKPDFPILKDELGGLAQEKNAKTVLTAVEELKKIGYYIPEDAVYNGFAHVVELTGLMGRWQIMRENPKIICDTAHNAHGIRYIVEQLKSESCNRLHIVFGMVNDKDINAVLTLLPKGAIYYFTKASIERALDVQILANLAATYGLQGSTYSTVEEAINAAKDQADIDDVIFIGGSSFIVAEALPLFLSSEGN